MLGTGNTPWSDSSTVSLRSSTIPSTPVAQPTNTLPYLRLGIALSLTLRSALTLTTRYVPICVVLYIISSSSIGAKTPGDHDYSSPLGPLKDQTNQGPIWDVTKNFRAFWYTPSSGAVSLGSGGGAGGLLQPSEGASWLNFGGAWGDKQWPIDRFGQYCVADQCHITDGPTGKHVTTSRR
jgi:hypothetical protein